jgi:hypothetical protein
MLSQRRYESPLRHRIGSISLAYPNFVEKPIDPGMGGALRVWWAAARAETLT